VNGSAEVLEAIGVAAGRIRRYGEAIAQAHEFGIAEGAHDELWSLDFQRSATPIYVETVPWSYMTKLAANFDNIAAKMAMLNAPDAAAPSWSNIQSYLRSTTTALSEAAPSALPVVGHGLVPEIDPTPPPVIRFARLATNCTRAAAAALIESARCVEQVCGQDDVNPLSEQEKGWLQQLIAGDRVLDIATDEGYSERTMYRALGDLWDRLDVENRNEAIAVVTEKGWL
jgi:DNA-binding CsgD family transcriptional regulator